MKHLYKFILVVGATSWVVVFYGIKEEWTIFPFHPLLFSLMLLSAPIVLSAIGLILSLSLRKETFGKCTDLEEADNSFLPTYLGYFFVGLGVERIQHLTFVYLMILIFVSVLASRAKYFNPIFLLFGYRSYNAKSSQGTSVLLIVRQNLRNANEVNFDNLRRINDTTFIGGIKK